MAWIDKLHHPAELAKAFAKWLLLGVLVGASADCWAPASIMPFIL